MQIINLSDESYEVKYVISLNKINDEQSLKFRDLHNCDIVIKNEQFYHFCNIIQTVEFQEVENNKIEEENNNSTTN